MTRFDPEVLANDPERRAGMLRVAAAAIGAVDPYRAVVRHGLPVVPEAYDRAVVLGIGKAAVPMGRAAVGLLDQVPTDGVLVTNRVARAGHLEVLPGGHPVPDTRSVAAGARLLETAATVGEGDLAVVLISGGGSALVEATAGDLDLDDLQQTTSLLLRSGATIAELNTVRKHLSRIKGGRLAEALSAAGSVVVLVLSDVVGNPLDVIASGPMVPDPTTFADAVAVLERYGLGDAVPAPVAAHLAAGVAGRVPETPSGGDVFAREHVGIVADAATAASAAASAGRAEGWSADVVTTELVGEAREAARRLVADAESAAPGSLAVHAGETTVTVAGDGTGGRNQELALAAGIALYRRDDVVVLSVGTDGIDGMTGAAGGFGDGGLMGRAATAGLDAGDHLARNDSNTLLAATGDLVVCGPTGTNVGDLILVLRT